MWFALIVVALMASGAASPAEAAPGVWPADRWDSATAHGRMDGMDRASPVPTATTIEPNAAIETGNRRDKARLVRAEGPATAHDAMEWTDRASPAHAADLDTAPITTQGTPNPDDQPPTINQQPTTDHPPPTTHHPPTTPWPRPALVPELSADAQVTLLTMLPGEDVYSLWGHTALRVYDPEIGVDRTYNYGTFDFDQPNFLLRFLRGQTDYQLAVATYDQTLFQYRMLDRPVIEQVLDLEPADRQAVFLYLETNLLPENRVYRYDFIFDNCSTRPRDALEWVLGDRLTLGGYQPPDATIREMIRPYTAGAPLTAFGIELGFGRPVDREPTRREAAFLPLELFDAFEEATVDGRPLVARTDTLFWVEDAGLPAPAPDVPTILATLLLLLAIGLTLWPAAPPRALAVLDGFILALAGLVGLLLALMWFATEHHVTRINPDLLWAWPTHIVAAVVIARARARRIEGNVARTYVSLASAAAGTAGLLGVVGILPMHSAAAALALLIAVRGADRVGTGELTTWRRREERIDA